MSSFKWHVLRTLFLKTEPHFWQSWALLNFLHFSYQHGQTIHDFAYLFSWLSFCFRYLEAPPGEIFLSILKPALSTVSERVLMLNTHLFKENNKTISLQALE